MTFRFVRAGLAALVLSGAPSALPAVEVRVFAASSLAEVLAEIVESSKKSGIDVSLNLEGSNVLVRQILDGAHADLIITADELSMKRLVFAGEIALNDVKPLLSNTLVIAGPIDFPPINSPEELLESKFRRIAIADETTAPAGVYARTALKTVGVWSKIVSRILPTENVRDALAALESGNAQAAIVYHTDVDTSRNTHIIWEFRGDSAPDIIYPAAVFKSAPSQDSARRFLAFLESEEAAAIFRRHGFGIVDAK